jgi:PAS domain S-box-containing protein
VTADDGDGPGRATVQAVSIAAATCKYRSLVESSSDLIWSADEAGRKTFINQAARRIYGYEPGEMLGRPIANRCL